MKIIDWYRVTKSDIGYVAIRIESVSDPATKPNALIIACGAYPYLILSDGIFSWGAVAGLRRPAIMVDFGEGSIHTRVPGKVVLHQVPDDMAERIKSTLSESMRDDI